MLKAAVGGNMSFFKADLAASVAQGKRCVPFPHLEMDQGKRPWVTCTSIAIVIKPTALMPWTPPQQVMFI